VTVEYRPFGRTGVQISSLTLGAMNFGQPPSLADPAQRRR
jgi:aryl-alcohol dehydrogenase-like predicted oxidoreductase